MDYPTSDAGARLHNGKFTDGDPVNNIPPSKDSAVYQNMVFDELLNVISSAGLTPDELQDNQLSTAINTLISNSSKGLSEGDLPDLPSFERLNSLNGYQKLPGGLTIQWGRADNIAINNTGHPIVFPLAFENEVFHIGCQWIRKTAISGTIEVLVRKESISPTGFTVEMDYDSNTYGSDSSISFIAIGY